MIATGTTRQKNRNASAKVGKQHTWLGRIPIPIWVAILTPLIAGAFSFSIESHKWPEEKPPPLPHDVQTCVAGSVLEKHGSPIPDVEVRIGRGFTTVTDMHGKFVLNGVPPGDKILELRGSYGHSATQSIKIKTTGTTELTAVYDKLDSQIGLLTITNPVSMGGWTLTSYPVQDAHGRTKIQYAADVSGSCLGLWALYDQLGIWVLLKSERDNFFWVQREAIIDPSNNTWSAHVLLGDGTNLPQKDQQWDIIAVASEHSASSGINKFQYKREGLPHPNDLPPHVTSNVVLIKLTDIPK
jgi:hypothetical protein